LTIVAKPRLSPPEERQEAPPALARARHAIGARQEEDAQQEVALSRERRSSRDVIDGEEETGRHAARPVSRGPAVEEHEHCGGRQPAEVEDTKGDVPGPAHGEQRQVDEVDAGHVHVEQVAVRDGSRADQPGDVVHYGGVVNQRPPE
jgi:hypothetical protein